VGIEPPTYVAERKGNCGGERESERRGTHGGGTEKTHAEKSVDQKKLRRGLLASNPYLLLVLFRGGRWPILIRYEVPKTSSRTGPGLVV